MAELVEVVRRDLEEASRALEALLHNEAMLASVADAGRAIAAAIRAGGKVMSCGNGGSLCDSMHFAEEMTGRYRDDRRAYPAVAIADASHIACVGNDYGYEHVFSRYVEGVGRPGDVLLAISTSGTSRNVVAAARAARAKQITVIGMTGKPGTELCRLSAAVPASGCADYGRQIAVFTKGRGSLSAAFLDWEPCADQEKVIRERAYDPCRDVWNTPDSVFCSHGAGYTVPWNEADALMHLPFLKDPARQETPAPSAGGSSSGYRGTREEDLALEKIFERTYGPVKARQLTAAPTAAVQKQQDPARESVAESEILLIDGYNVIHAWDEWKPFLPDRLGDARDALRELMCEYAGVTGRSVILVFDAYAVPGNPGKAEKYKNIYVVYTREAQTADAYIEKTTLLARSRARIRVVTSDRPEQLIALGNEALRTSAREFRREVIAVQGNIADYLARNYRPGTERSLERLYKEAWKKNKA